jgi:hypothetical protein
LTCRSRHTVCPVHTPQEAAMSICNRVFPRSARFALPALAAMHLGIASATLITFDDLPAPPPDDFAGAPLTDQYVSKGLLIDGAYLSRPVFGSTNQALLGSNFATLTFLNTLPTFVSLSVSSEAQDKVYVQASGPSFSQIVATSGWAGPFNNSPYKPNELVSFASPGGISTLNLSAFYDLRVGPIVDNLYFGAVPAVPEPPSWVLMGVGLALLAGRKVQSSRQRRTALRSDCPPAAAMCGPLE